MAENTNIVVKQITGKAHWFKVLGAPVPNYSKDGFEWTFDVSLDEATKKELIGYGLASKIKNKGDEKGDYITFKRASVKRSGPKAGEANDPIRVVSPDGKTPWDKSIKVGNGSTIKVKFSINEVVNKRTKERSMRADPLSIQVFEYVPFVEKERQEFDANPVAQEVPAPAENW